MKKSSKTTGYQPPSSTARFDNPTSDQPPPASSQGRNPSPIKTAARQSKVIEKLLLPKKKLSDTEIQSILSRIETLDQTQSPAKQESTIKAAKELATQLLAGEINLAQNADNPDAVQNPTSDVLARIATAISGALRTNNLHQAAHGSAIRLLQRFMSPESLNGQFSPLPGITDSRSNYFTKDVRSQIIADLLAAWDHLEPRKQAHVALLTASQFNHQMVTEDHRQRDDIVLEVVSKLLPFAVASHASIEKQLKLAPMDVIHLIDDNILSLLRKLSAAANDPSFMEGLRNTQQALSENGRDAQLAKREFLEILDSLPGCLPLVSDISPSVKDVSFNRDMKTKLLTVPNFASQINIDAQELENFHKQVLEKFDPEAISNEPDQGARNVLQGAVALNSLRQERLGDCGACLNGFGGPDGFYPKIATNAPITVLTGLEDFGVLDDLERTLQEPCSFLNRIPTTDSAISFEAVGGRYLVEGIANRDDGFRTEGEHLVFFSVLRAIAAESLIKGKDAEWQVPDIHVATYEIDDQGNIDFKPADPSGQNRDIAFWISEKDESGQIQSKVCLYKQLEISQANGAQASKDIHRLHALLSQVSENGEIAVMEKAIHNHLFDRSIKPYSRQLLSPPASLVKHVITDRSGGGSTPLWTPTNSQPVFVEGFNKLEKTEVSPSAQQGFGYGNQIFVYSNPDLPRGVPFPCSEAITSAISSLFPKAPANTPNLVPKLTTFSPNEEIGRLYLLGEERGCIIFARANSDGRTPKTPAEIVAVKNEDVQKRITSHQYKTYITTPLAKIKSNSEMVKSTKPVYIGVQNQNISRTAGSSSSLFQKRR